MVWGHQIIENGEGGENIMSERYLICAFNGSRSKGIDYTEYIWGPFPDNSLMHSNKTDDRTVALTMYVFFITHWDHKVFLHKNLGYSKGLSEL